MIYCILTTYDECKDKILPIVLQEQTIANGYFEKNIFQMVLYRTSLTIEDVDDIINSSLMSAVFNK